MAAQDSRPFHWHYPDLDDKNFELHGRSLFFLLFVVFVVLLFFSLLCLYIRWACRFPGTSRQDGLNSRLSPPHGLDPKVINSLPVLLHKQAAAAASDDGGRDGGEDSMCSICLSIFTEGQKVKMLPKCRHTFHPECVDEWMKMQSTCPLCRSCIGEVQRIIHVIGDDHLV